MIIKTKYDIGDIVYLKTDISQKERMITMIGITPGNNVYTLSCGDDSSDHYEIEITDTKDVIKTLTSYDD
jgi:hypothetical protein